MNEQRWFSGDTHVHFLSTQGSLREAQAEDLNVVNLLQSQWGSLFTNTEDFTGEPVVSRDGRTIVWTNQENRQHLLGHMILLGLKEPVYPWCSDGPSEAELGGTLETTLSAWADACHAQGGTVILPHFPNPNGEPAALVATGRIDAVEMIVRRPVQPPGVLPLPERRLPPAAGRRDGQDVAATSRSGSTGPTCTFRRTRSSRYDTWCRNLKRGPDLSERRSAAGVFGRRRADRRHAPAARRWRNRRGERHGAARSCRSTRCRSSTTGRSSPRRTSRAAPRTLSLQTQVAGHARTAGCARACPGRTTSRSPHHDVLGARRVRAHLADLRRLRRRVGDGRPGWPAVHADAGRRQPRLHPPPQRRNTDHGTVTHHHGEADHQAYLERPFLEAQALLRARLGIAP